MITFKARMNENRDDSIYKTENIIPVSGEGINVIITTERQNRHEYVYDEKLQREIYKPNKALPYDEFDLGYIPNTIYNGEPLKVIIISETPFKKESLITCATAGAVSIKHGLNGNRKNYDYIIAIPATSNLTKVFKTIGNIDSTLFNQMEFFLISYNKIDLNGLFPIKKLGRSKTTQFISKCVTPYLH